MKAILTKLQSEQVAVSIMLADISFYLTEYQDAIELETYVFELLPLIPLLMLNNLNDKENREDGICCLLTLIHLMSKQHFDKYMESLKTDDEKKVNSFQCIEEDAHLLF